MYVLVFCTVSEKRSILGALVVFDFYYVYDTLWIKRKLRVGMVKCFVAFIDFPRQRRNLRLETEECRLRAYMRASASERSVHRPFQSVMC